MMEFWRVFWVIAFVAGFLAFAYISYRVITRGWSEIRSFLAQFKSPGQ